MNAEQLEQCRQEWTTAFNAGKMDKLHYENLMHMIELAKIQLTKPRG